LGTS